MNMAVFDLGFMWWWWGGGDPSSRWASKTDDEAQFTFLAFVALLLCQRPTMKRALQIEVDRLCYFPLFEYSIDCLYINIWCGYKFIKFPQYIFLKALSSLDRDYIFLISLPWHQSFIQDATQEKKGGNGNTFLFSASCIQLLLLCSRWGMGLMIEAC